MTIFPPKKIDRYFAIYSLIWTNPVFGQFLLSTFSTIKTKFCSKSQIPTDCTMFCLLIAAHAIVYSLHLCKGVRANTGCVPYISNTRFHYDPTNATGLNCSDSRFLNNSEYKNTSIFSYMNMISCSYSPPLHPFFPLYLQSMK